jgi:DNA polymerase
MFFGKEEIRGRRSGQSKCFPCELSQVCKTPEMPPSGKGEKGILVIAEAPGATEDERGTQLIGQAGQRLRSILLNYGIDLDRDCRKTNAVNCRPPDNRVPTSKEIDLCRLRVWEEIATFKPKLILLLGNAAIESFLGHRWKKELGGVTKWRGFVIPDSDAGCWAMATYHPSYLLRSQGQPVVETVFRQDIQLALQHLEAGKNSLAQSTEPRQVSAISPEQVGGPRGGQNSIKLLRSGAEAVQELRNLYRDLSESGGLMAFDYETTGLKPYDPGHEIVCCGVATENRAFAFEMTPDRELRRWWRRLLTAESILKTAHNMRFEDTWTNVILGYPVVGWRWCSMLASHVLDNRPGITGLKFQAYVNFGIVDYASKIEPYLTTTDGRGFNRAKEAPLKDLMRYCGMDAWLQYRLAKKQIREVLYGE